jgi:membrane protease YdiL (CAAX protease family)
MEGQADQGGDRRGALRGLSAYVLLSILGSTAVAVALAVSGLELGSAAGGIAALGAMWIPSLARLVAVRGLDPSFVAPFPVRRFGSTVRVVAFPMLAVAAIYGVAYALSWVSGVPRSPPVWIGAGSVIANVALNGAILSLWGLAGGLGEELGWRGYFQPRLDQLGVPGSVWIASAVETIFHLPLIVLAGYAASGSLLESAALFLGLKLAHVPVWTFLTYRLRSIWVAALVHSFHNTLSQTLLPKALGAGSARWLGESGVFPIVAYAFAGVACWLLVRRSSEGWRTFLHEAVENDRRSKAVT